MSGEGEEMRTLVLDEVPTKHAQGVSHLQSEFSAVRTGRASSGWSRS